MKLIPKDIEQKLLANGAQRGVDHKPVLKLFTPWAGATWLITEMDPEDHDLLYGLCDLGQGFPELGTIWLPELVESRIEIERDQYFVATKTLSEYADEARAASRIVA